LILYASSLQAPARARAPLSAAAERGRELFSSPHVGCATCHTSAMGVDGSLHDVGSGGSFDTPSLRFVGGTAPYYHDGRYATLREVLVASDGKMGWAGKLSEPDLEALEAYLKNL
jgi:cytochrome c peroxidase